MISNVGTGFVGDDDELLCICWRGVVLDIRIEESPVDTWYLKPWKAVRLFRGSKWADTDSWDTNLKGRKWKRFGEV